MSNEHKLDSSKEKIEDFFKVLKVELALDGEDSRFYEDCLYKTNINKHCLLPLDPHNIVRGYSGSYYRLCTYHVETARKNYPFETKVSEKITLWSDGLRRRT